MRVAKTPDAIRREAAEMVRAEARDRAATGDPEGAGVLRDLAKRIRYIPLTERTP